MKRAILPILCGSAIALTWAGYFDFSHRSDLAYPPVQAQESERNGPMTLEHLEDILSGAVESGAVENLEGANGQWGFQYDGVPMVLITSQEYDRMRLIAPIIKLEDLTDEQRQNMLIANFHTALDARYAIGTLGGEPAVVAAFLHPLSSLEDDHFRSALSQVGESAKTFGTTYSSGGILLRPNGRPQAPSGNLEI